jgi:hypothetical protein
MNAARPGLSRGCVGMEGESRIRSSWMAANRLDAQLTLVLMARHLRRGDCAGHSTQRPDRWTRPSACRHVARRGGADRAPGCRAVCGVSGGPRSLRGPRASSRRSGRWVTWHARTIIALCGGMGHPAPRDHTAHRGYRLFGLTVAPRAGYHARLVHRCWAGTSRPPSVTVSCRLWRPCPWKASTPGPGPECAAPGGVTLAAPTGAVSGVSAQRPEAVGTARVTPRRQRSVSACSGPMSKERVTCWSSPT